MVGCVTSSALFKTQQHARLYIFIKEQTRRTSRLAILKHSPNFISLRTIHHRAYSTSHETFSRKLLHKRPSKDWVTAPCKMLLKYFYTRSKYKGFTLYIHRILLESDWHLISSQHKGILSYTSHFAVKQYNPSQSVFFNTSIIMILTYIPGIVLCVLMRAAQKRQRRLAFHCPIHGDFYPMSPQNSRKYSRKFNFTYFDYINVPWSCRSWYILK